MTTLIEDVTVIGGVDTHKHTTTPRSSTSTAGCSAIGSSPLPPPDTKHYGPG